MDFFSKTISSLIQPFAVLLSRKEKKEYLILSSLSMLSGFSEVLGIGVVVLYITLCLNLEQYPQIVEISKQINQILGSSLHPITILGLGFMGIYFLKTCFIFFVHRKFSLFVGKVRTRVTTLLFEKYIYMPYSKFLHCNIAILQRNLQTEAQYTFHSFFNSSMKGITDFFSLLSILIFLLFFKPVMTLALLGIFILCGGSLYIFVHKILKSLGIQRHEYAGQVLKSSNEALYGYKEITVLQRRKYFRSTFFQQIQVLSKADAHLRMMDPTPRLISELLLVLAIVSSFIYSFSLELAKEEVLSLMTLFGIAGLRVIMLMNRMLGTFNELFFYLPSAQIIASEIQKYDENVTKEPVELPENSSPERGILIKNLSYIYPNSKDYALKNIQISIPIHHSIAFVGSSGAGKSTLMNLLLALLKPDQGNITVDGQDIYENLPLWYQQVGYIPQQNYLLDGSILENIAFGFPTDQMDIKKVKKALETAEILTFVESLPQGMHTFVGENGIQLSGGQRQRICIARVLYQNPSILILDEATAALDNVKEKKFLENLERDYKEKTIIHIAHRLSTVKHCDCIYYMEKGEITASGTFDELVKNSPSFSKMAYANS